MILITLAGSTRRFSPFGYLPYIVCSFPYLSLLSGSSLNSPCFHTLGPPFRESSPRFSTTMGGIVVGVYLRLA